MFLPSYRIPAARVLRLFLFLIFAVMAGRAAFAQEVPALKFPKLSYPDVITAFYETRDNKPYWQGQIFRARTLRKTLEKSWEHGLNPANYHLAEIEALREDDSYEARNQIELLMSDAFIRYARDMTGRRVDLDGLAFDAQSWRKPLAPAEALALLSGGGGTDSILRSLEPKGKTYKRLREELVELSADPEANKSLLLKLVANLERLRWTEETRPDRFIVVNIPSGMLWAMDKGRVALEMPVIVGRRSRPTYSFVTSITGVRFNPNWTVPPTIKKEDIVPKIVNNPDYLAGKGMELISYANGEAETIDPASVDWENITPQELASLKMVQIPGAHNPLGRVRVLMPNRYDIYLHGTNNQNDFNNPSNTISSGCVRLKEPERLADFILSGNPDWNSGRVAELISNTRTRDIMVEQKIPVYLMYYTIWIDEEGRIVYGEDVYNQDLKLIKKLEKIDGFNLSGHTFANLTSLRFLFNCPV